jgi:hypothetical protein
LRALLSLIAEQTAVLEEDLEQLYDDQFIETCAEWVVPYIGDLVGVRAPFAFPGAAFSQRAEVANTLAYRRRKGTASVLEQLARDVTGWPANVVEFFQRLATTQYMNHIRLFNHAAPDLRDWLQLERLDTPFESTARTAEMRRIEPRRGRYNIPNIGLFLWRIGSFPITRGPAFRVDDRRFLFDSLGKDTALYNAAATETAITHLAGPDDVPMPFSRRVLDRDLELHYGERSILISVDGADVLADLASPPAASISELIRVCDLSDVTDEDGDVLGWAHQPQDRIAIDPVLGRIAFPLDAPAPQQVQVSYYYGFTARMGGGQYGRAATFAPSLSGAIRVPADAATLDAALADAAGAGAVEIENNDYHAEAPDISAAPGARLELRAADERRPTILLSGPLDITGGEGAEVTLNGLLIAGGSLRVPASAPDGSRNGLRLLRIRHCTLVPGDTPLIGDIPAQPAGPRVIVEAPGVIVEIEDSIVGSLRAADGAQVRISNSIVDALAEDAVAYAGLDDESAGATLDIRNTTLIGKVRTVLLLLASNTIFFSRLGALDDWSAPLLADRTQEGCARFSYLPPGSRAPRRFRCQPECPDKAARLRPVFTSRRYGDPGYLQLSLRTAREIREGADDGAEMGAFHDLYQPQREANLRLRLDEYLRFGLEAGIFFAS